MSVVPDREGPQIKTGRESGFCSWLNLNPHACTAVNNAFTGESRETNGTKWPFRITNEIKSPKSQQVHGFFIDKTDVSHDHPAERQEEHPPGMLFLNEWAYEDSNLGPHPYQGCALAS